MSNLSSDGFGHTYRTYWSRVVAYLKQRTHDSDRAEELAQETFVKAWNAKVSGEPGPLTAQLLKIASSTLIDQSRSQKARASRESKIAYLRDASDEAADPAQRQEEMEHLIQAIEELSPRTREVLILHRLKHRSQREIAADLGISLNMVEKHLIKAMRHCRQKLKRFQ